MTGNVKGQSVFINNLNNSKISIDNLNAIKSNLNFKGKVLNTDLEFEKKPSTLKMIGLSLVTFGVYYLLYSRRTDKKRVFNKIVTQLQETTSIIPEGSKAEPQKTASVAGPQLESLKNIRKALQNKDFKPDMLSPQDRKEFDQLVEGLREERIKNLKDDRVQFFIAACDYKLKQQNMTPREAQQYRDSRANIHSSIEWRKEENVFKCTLPEVYRVAGEEYIKEYIKSDNEYDYELGMEPEISPESILLKLKHQTQFDTPRITAQQLQFKIGKLIPDEKEEVNQENKQLANLAKQLLFSNQAGLSKNITPEFFTEDVRAVATKIWRDMVVEKMLGNRDQIVKDLLEDENLINEWSNDVIIEFVLKPSNISSQGLTREQIIEHGRAHSEMLRTNLPEFLRSDEGFQFFKIYYFPGFKSFPVTFSDWKTKLNSYNAQEVLTIYEEVNLTRNTIIEINNIARAFWPDDNSKERLKADKSLIELEDKIIAKEKSRFA